MSDKQRTPKEINDLDILLTINQVQLTQKATQTGSLYFSTEVIVFNSDDLNESLSIPFEHISGAEFSNGQLTFTQNQDQPLQTSIAFESETDEHLAQLFFKLHDAFNENYQQLSKEVDMLNMKLRLKEKYIEELEQQKTKKKKTTPRYTKSKTIDDHFIALDIETTGLHHEYHDIIQIALIEYQNNQPVKTYMKYFRPTRNISTKVTQITGITNAFIEDKDFIQYEDLQKILTFIGDNTIVAHNASFDMKFLIRYFDDFNIDIPEFNVVDTLTLARRLMTEVKNHKLETLKQHFDLTHYQSHDALDDAKVTGELALILKDRQTDNT